MTKSMWNADLERQLLRLVREKKTSTKIAQALRPHQPSMTRNAVIGKLKRMGVPLLTTRPKPRKPARAVFELPASAPETRDRIVRRSRVVNVKVTISGEVDVENDVGISLLIAGNGACRWPLEGRAADGCPRCCGSRCMPDTSYCAVHAARAFIN